MGIAGNVRLVSEAVNRKARMFLKRVPRARARVTANGESYRQRPPIVVSTIPKSGTHLVHQIVTALPDVVDYGTFIATTVSWRQRPRSVATLTRLIGKVAPGEVVRAHLVHHPDLVHALAAKNAFVVFVYRDPRDVIVSEAHYLTDSAPWHALHRTFSRLPPEQRIDVAIDGLGDRPDLYPDVAARYTNYEGWLDDADVAVGFEELVGPDRDDGIRRIVTAYAARHPGDVDVEATVRRAVDAIAPERSHTFREGKPGEWRATFSPEQKRRFDEVAGPVLKRYGYEPDH
jgi:sulfotransferase 6B1